MIYHDYEWVTGRQHTAKLLYSKSQKCLFTKCISRNGGTDYICYQQILKKNTKLNALEAVIPCTSRVKVMPDGKYKSKLIGHSAHENHEHIYKDLKTKADFLDKVKTLENMLEGLPVNVSNRDIFTIEMAK